MHIEVNVQDAQITSDVRTKGGYTAIPNRTMADYRLRPATAAILHYMLHRTSIDGWQFRVRDICNHFQVGKRGDAVRRALRELEELGYLTRTQRRSETGGFLEVAYHVEEISPSAPQLRRGGAPQPSATSSAKAELKPKTKAENQAAHQLIAGTYNEHCGPLPQRETNGNAIIIPDSVARLMQKLIKQQGTVPGAVETVRLATIYAAREAASSPGGWIARNCSLETVIRNAANYADRARARQRTETAESNATSEAGEPFVIPEAAR